MAMPIFLPRQLWRWTTRWSQASSLGNRNATVLEGNFAEDGVTGRCAPPSRRWPTKTGTAAAEAALVETRTEGNAASVSCIILEVEQFHWWQPWSLPQRLPFAPFSSDRSRL